MGVAQNFYLLNARRMQGKCALNSDPMRGYAPYREVGIGSRASADAHDRAANELNSLSFSLDDPKVNLHIISDAEVIEIRLETDVFLLLLLFHRA
jgi:hypothetical protein